MLSHFALLKFGGINEELMITLQWTVGSWTTRKVTDLYRN